MGDNMNEFAIELFLCDKDEQSIKPISLKDKDIDVWKSDLEANALSEYYEQKVNVSVLEN